MNKTYQPLEDRVLVRPIKPTEEKTEGGIIKDMMRKETQQAEVVSVGPGRYAADTGTFMPTILSPGDIVIIPFDYGMNFDTPDEKDLKLMREADVLLLVKKAGDSEKVVI